MSSGLLAGAVGPAVEDFQAGSEVDAGTVRFCACVSFDELVRGCFRRMRLTRRLIARPLWVGFADSSCRFPLTADVVAQW